MQQKEMQGRTRRGMIVLSDGHVILLINVKNDRRLNWHHGLQRIKYFFLISRRIILENHGSWLPMKSQLTRKKKKEISLFLRKKIRPLKNHEYSLYLVAELRQPKGPPSGAPYLSCERK